MGGLEPQQSSGVITKVDDDFKKEDLRQRDALRPQEGSRYKVTTT